MDLNQDSSVEKAKALTELLRETNQAKLDRETTEAMLKNLGFLSLEREAKLVSGKSGGRFYLLKAFEEADCRIIIQCPWISDRIFADEIMNGLNYALERGVKVNLGFGYLDDIGTLIKLDRNRKLISSDQKYSALPKLLTLQGLYPDRLHLKLTGDHSKYCVCDHKFAYLGSHNFLSSTGANLRALTPVPKCGELGCVFYRPQKEIQELITYYDTRSDLTQSAIIDTKMKLAA